MKIVKTVTLCILLTYGLSYQINAATSVERPKFSRVELLSISTNPSVLVVRDEFDDTQTIRLAPGAKITSNGKLAKVSDLKAGDTLYIATRLIISNIILSDQSPSEADLASHKTKPKLIEVTVDKEMLEQSAKQFYIAVSLALFGFVVLILIFIVQTTKKNRQTDHRDEKSNRRSI